MVAVEGVFAPRQRFQKNCHFCSSQFVYASDGACVVVKGVVVLAVGNLVTAAIGLTAEDVMTAVVLVELYTPASMLSTVVKALHVLVDQRPVANSSHLQFMSQRGSCQGHV